MNWKVFIIILVVIVVGIVGYLFLSGQRLTPGGETGTTEESIPQPPKLPE
ncbi:MAG: hypothetical protein AAB529_02745 [Patescibacteria group bacterium]